MPNRNMPGNIRTTQHTAARSRNLCCSGKEISITHSGCVSIDLDIQNAMRMCRITPSCDLPGSTIFFHIIS